VVAPGYVYVLLEPMNPSMVKIGLTRGPTSARVRALNGTGRAVPQVALWDEYVSDPEYVEGALHDLFTDSRVNRGREFFYVSPKAAIAALMDTAAPYRLEPFRHEGRIEVLPRLRATFGDIIRDEITSVEVLVTHQGVVLATTSRTASRDTKVVRSNLDFIYGGDDPIFSSDIPAEENAQRLLNLDELTLVMTTNLVSDADSHRIDREQNSDRTNPWLDPERDTAD
jgi:hypothetical protein